MTSFCRFFSTILLLVIASSSGKDAEAQTVAPYFEGERILINGEINGEPVRLVYDTGASFSALLSHAAERLDLKVEAKQNQRVGRYQVPIGRTEPVEFGMFGQTMSTPIRVVITTRKAPFDGVMSWKNVNASHILIDGYDRRIQTLNELPADGWQRWKLEAENSQLFFVVGERGKELGRVFVDTGAVCGLRLSPQLWSQWRQDHPEAGVTLETFRYFVGKTEPYELAWAEEYSLGGLTFHDVDLGRIPESGDNVAIDADGKGFIAMIGIRALRNLRMIISRKDNVILTQTVAPVPDHNRLGAVFVPEPEDDSLLRCHVLDGSPAARSGLMNGDVLIRIEDVNFRGNEELRDPSSFFSRPAGTTLEIVVLRGEETLPFKVQLEDLLH